MAEPATTLQALEERLLQPSVRADRAEVAALLAPNFQEFGSSGRIFDRQATLAALAAEQADPANPAIVQHFTATLLAPGVVLATYRIQRPLGPASLRSSVWVERDGTWQMLFHQGTRVPVDA